MDWKILLGVPGAIVATIAIWGSFGFPTPATSGDIQRLNREQADVAVEVYSNKLRSLYVAPPPENSIANKVWLEELTRARKQLDRAEQRRIELSK